jgi:predicted RNA-binding Zn ribbon-like protein
VDFVGYAEGSARLLNAGLTDPDALVAILPGRDWLHPQVTERDVTTLRRFQRELRPVFDAADAGDVPRTIDLLNDAMVRHPITPRISDHDPEDLHLHVATKAASVAELLIGEALLGLATLVCDLGPTRLGVCSEAKCDNVYVDTSPNRSRRYCSDRCSSRANVAAYRARQKEAAP